jgi:hypothetical protein
MLKEQKHTLDGVEYRIITTEIVRSEYGELHCVDVLFHTPRGRYKVPLKISDELISNEESWKDYVCKHAHENYKRNHT